MEIWRDIRDYEDSYQVSNYGNVRSKDRYTRTWNSEVFKKGVIKNQKEDKNGYLRVWLSKKSKKKAFFVHRLVADSFIQNDDNLPIVNHLNNTPSDNRAENLEWTTVSGNTKHAFRNGYRKPHDGGMSVKVLCEFPNGEKKIYKSMSSLANDLKVGVGLISYYSNSNKKLHGKYNIKKI